MRVGDKSDYGAIQRAVTVVMDTLEPRALFSAFAGLDPAFGSGGIARSHFGSFSVSTAGDVVIQPDGKILAVGTVLTNINQTGGDVALARYNSDGSPDDTFGDHGLVTTNVYSFGGQDSRDDGHRIALLPGGKFLVDITSSGSGPDLSIVIRYNADGSIDQSFATNGMAEVPIGFAQMGQWMLTQSDGKIVLVGTKTHQPANPATDIFLTRLNADGSLDTGFATNGIATLDLADNDYLDSAALAPDGGILILSSAPDGNGSNPVHLTRFTTSGDLDTTFGNQGGIVAIANTTETPSLLVQPNGGMIMSAYDANGFLLKRFGSDGQLDTSFGQQGVQRDNLARKTSTPEKCCWMAPAGSSWRAGMMASLRGFLLPGSIRMELSTTHSEPTARTFTPSRRSRPFQPTTKPRRRWRFKATARSSSPVPTRTRTHSSWRG